MQRRKFLTTGLVAGAVATAAKAPTILANDVREWKMVTTWPKNFPGLGTGAAALARYITEMSGGRLKVTVYGGGELVPPLGIFDAVSEGAAEMGHGAAYYWKGKSNAAQFFATVPFGLTASELNAWVYYGGGQELWDDIYADFNLKPFLAGNTGVQMAGWFNREINSLDDFKGLIMRMPGLGGEVLGEIGAVPKLLPGGEIYTALQTGAIDATEWVGPYNDLAFGFYKIAKFYYYPGWHEPGTGLEAFVNKKAYDALPNDLKTVVKVATQAANNDMFAEFNARNGQALTTLINKHNVQFKRLPNAVIEQLRVVSEDVVQKAGNADPASKKVYDSYAKFRADVAPWTGASEQLFTEARKL